MEKKEKIAIKIRSMKKYVDFLRSYQSVTEERLEENYELKSAIERNFHLAIESALDIGEIIISAYEVCSACNSNHREGQIFLYNFSIQL